MTEIEIALHEVKVSDLKRQWDAACKRFNHYETLPALLDELTALKKLQEAEDELMAMKEQERYEASLTVPTNIRQYDPELEDSLDSKFAWRN